MDDRFDAAPEPAAARATFEERRQTLPTDLEGSAPRRRNVRLITAILATSDVAAVVCAFLVSWVVHGGRASGAAR